MSISHYGLPSFSSSLNKHSNARHLAWIFSRSQRQQHGQQSRGAACLTACLLAGSEAQKTLASAPSSSSSSSYSPSTRDVNTVLTQRI